MFVRSDGGTFNSDMVLLGGDGRVNGDLVVSLVTVWQTQVIVLQLHIHIGEDELEKQNIVTEESELIISLHCQLLYRISHCLCQ